MRDLPLMPRPLLDLILILFFRCRELLMRKTRRLGRDVAMMTEAGSTTFQMKRSALESST